jgi:hypothetical protein
MSEEEDALAAALGLRWWRRAERRAVADYERWTGQTLRRLAFTQTPVLAASAAGWPPGTAGPAGVVSLTLPGWQVLLAGVAQGPRIALLSQAALHLDAAGRYGRFWWLQVQAGRGQGPDQKIVLLGSQLRLVPGGYGRGPVPGPAGAIPAATAPGGSRPGR